MVNLIKMKFFKIIVIALIAFGTSPLKAQQSFPYWNEVQKFKKQDSVKFPAANQILFIGSSSFTKWTDVQQYFPAYPILNRAFGGSTLLDLILYRYDILYAYQPKQIVIYCGENDFAASDTVTVQTVANRFQLLFQLIRSKYKNIPVAYVSMKPSPSRTLLLPKFIQANQLIKKYLATKNNTAYIDVYSHMLNADGKPMANIFLQDQLHMNATGYAIWKKIIQPYLSK
jgi:lysophospholipase L1-like esterase